MQALLILWQCISFLVHSVAAVLLQDFSAGLVMNIIVSRFKMEASQIVGTFHSIQLEWIENKMLPRKLATFTGICNCLGLRW